MIVLGDERLAREAYSLVQRESRYGLRPVSLVVDDPVTGGGTCSGPHTLWHRLDETAAALSVVHAIVVTHQFDSDEISQLLTRTGGRIRHWMIMPPLSRFPSLWLEPCEIARRPAYSTHNRLASPHAHTMKRLIDLSASILISLVSLPWFVLIVVAIRLTSPGPILYGQERIGLDGRRFRAWKFRTMHANADAILAAHLAEDPQFAEEWQAHFKLKRDPRVTWCGRWMRALSLDELPQIWNVLVGDMSLVGPRPIVAAEIDKYAKLYVEYAKVRPGITGLWQVSGRNDTTYEERVALDVYYVQNWSPWLDIYILACTIKVVLRGEGAY